MIGAVNYIADVGVNMSKIESRHSKRVGGEFRIYGGLGEND